MDNDMREYQQLKVSAEMEREATAKLYESLKFKHGDTAARQILKQRGYNINIL
jgi:DNA-dependent RNA polymerase auxiliary subunit epsilon